MNTKSFAFLLTALFLASPMSALASGTSAGSGTSGSSGASAGSYGSGGETNGGNEAGGGGESNGGNQDNSGNTNGGNQYYGVVPKVENPPAKKPIKPKQPVNCNKIGRVCQSGMGAQQEAGSCKLVCPEDSKKSAPNNAPLSPSAI